MFDAIGKRGRTKKLSPYRWVASSVLSLVLALITWGAVEVIQSVPQAAAAEDEPTPEIVFTQQVKPPPPPPPPPAAPPKSTVRPKRNALTKNVVKKEIKPPDPTPIPTKEEKVKEPEPEPEDDAASAGGVPGGVVGGVLGGVIGGVVGGTGTAPADVQEVSVKDVKFLNVREVQGLFQQGIPALARRAGLSAEAVVELTCAADGHVTDVRWISGNELFKDAIMSAARAAKFEPRQIPFNVRVPFKFTIK